MKKSLVSIFCILTVVTVVTLGIGTTVFALGKIPKERVPAPEIESGSAIVYCENTGEIIFEKNINEKINPYSTTKVMTALLAVQKLPLEKLITVSDAAAEVGDSTMDLNPGEQVTVEQLLYGTLLPSGNDAAQALGEAISGDVASFAALMNETAKNIGCKHTNFVNANGLKDANHYSTAYDMMQIFKVAMSNDTVRKISGTINWSMGATNNHDARELTNTSKLLKTKGLGVVAAKTGSWDTENSIVFLYEKNGLKLIVSIMNSTPEVREKDAEKLIKYGEAVIKGVKVVKNNTAEGKVAIKGGIKTRLDAYTSRDGYAYIPKQGSKELITTKVVMEENIKAPVKEGKVVGKYVIMLADEPVSEVPLIIKESVGRGWFPSQVGISNLATVLIASGTILFFSLWIYIGSKRKKARKRRERERQRRIMEMAKRQLAEEEDRKRRGWTF